MVLSRLINLRMNFEDGERIMRVNGALVEADYYFNGAPTQGPSELKMDGQWYVGIDKIEKVLYDKDIMKKEEDGERR